MLSREEEIRTAMQRSMEDLREHVALRREGVTVDLGDEVAERLLQAEITVYDFQLREEVAAKRRRPLLLGAWAGAALGVGTGIAFGSGEVAVGAIGAVIALHLYLVRKPEAQPPKGPRQFIHPHITANAAYRIAGENEKFTKQALYAIYGKDFIDSLSPDAVLPVGQSTRVEPIQFRDGEYPGLLNQQIHEIACRTLAMRVQNLDTTWPALPFMILHGDAGRGKTTIVKVLSQEIRDRLVELGMEPGHHIEAFGGDLTTAKKLDAVMRLATSIPGSVLFIDEIHAIPPEIAERLYLATDRDFRYKFEGDEFPRMLQPFTIVGATTDLGKLHKAFRSRAELTPLQLVPPEQLYALVLGMSYEVEPDAARAAVERTRWDGMPRAVINLLNFAREISKSRGRNKVTLADVEETFEIKQLDEWGLGPFHRDVVRALARSPVVVKRGTKAEHVVYKLSETSLLAMAKVDPVSFREDIRPALMDRGFMVTTSGGQQLTEAGLTYAQGIK